MSNKPLHNEKNNLCLARTRQGKSEFCQARKIIGKKRCRMHGGAKGSGAQKGNKNAFKHGRYSREFLENRRAATKCRREWIAFFKEIGKEIRKTY